MNLGFRELLRATDQHVGALGTWALLQAVAVADGEVTANETQAIEHAIRTLFDLDEQAWRQLRTITLRVDADPEDIEVYGRYYKREGSAVLGDRIVEALKAVAWADGRPDMRRTRALLRAADVTGLSPLARRALLAPPASVA